MNSKQKVPVDDIWISEPVRMVGGEKAVKRYRKIGKVGEGTYSICYLARTSDSGSTYVAKVIPKSKLQVLTKEKLIYEVRIHQQLSHENVVHLDHWFEDREYQYIFLEYCSGGNLERYLQNREMDEREIRRICKQIISAVAYIHSKNILHRDLKLCNFYLDDLANIKLGDFGFACQLTHHAELKRQTCGTPNYIAPEAVSGFGYSFSSDVWAIGIILYRLRFKKCPFEGANIRETLEKVKICQYSFPKNGKISNELKDLIEKILVINYDDRLSLEQIMAHSFFTQDDSKQSKRFSLMKLIFRNEQKQNESSKKEKRVSRISHIETGNTVVAVGNGDAKNNVTGEQTKRSNSCETFKEIKQIFKSKSKVNLQHSNLQSQMRTEESTCHSIYQTGKNGSKTMRTIMDSISGFGPQQKSSRMGHFIGNVTELLKKHPKISEMKSYKQLTLNQRNVVTQHQAKGDNRIDLNAYLISLAKKLDLPYEVQVEKDILIIHLSSSLKMLVYKSITYFVHQGSKSIFDREGQLLSEPPKMLRYVVDEKIKSGQETQNELDQYAIKQRRRIVPSVLWQHKDGIMLSYDCTFLVAKIYAQNMFYLGLRNESSRQQGKTAVMYLAQGNSLKAGEGVVIHRIYQGWIAHNLSRTNK